MDIKIEATPRTALRMKGDVLLCDPCYFFPSERSEFFEAWQDLVRQMFPEGKSGELTNSGVVKVTTSGGLEFEFIYVSTKYGDGVYSLTEISQIGTVGTEIGVDAGLICAVKAKDAKLFSSNVSQPFEYAGHSLSGAYCACHWLRPSEIRNASVPN
jgi:hypothetical protein